MEGTLKVIISKNEELPKNKNRDNIFTLNEYVLLDKEKKNINHFYPDPYKTSLNSEKILIKTEKVKSEILLILKDWEIFKDIEDLDELLEPFLDLKLTRFFYLQSVIPTFDIYILIKGKLNYSYSSKTDLILAIDRIYSDGKNKKNDFLRKFYKFENNFYNNFLLILQHKLLKIIKDSNKNSIYFFSDEKAYFIDSLKSKFKSRENLILYYSPTLSQKRIILLLLKQLLKTIFRKNNGEIGIFLLPGNKIIKNYNQIFSNIKSLKLNGINNKFSSHILKQLYSYVLHSVSYTNYLTEIFKDLKIEKSFFHSVRFPDLYSFASVLSNFNDKTYLISHGSHTIQSRKDIGYFASKSMGIGLTYTNKKDIKLLSQSTFCDDYLESMNLKFLKINKILNLKSSSSAKKNFYLENKKTKILYVGTVKQLGERRYYFESSGEFIESINQIYNKLKNYKNLFEVIIRIRDVKYEINKFILNNAFKDKKDLIRISYEKSIYEEINNCDCLISFSSTTLEEGIFMNKPVMCYGLPKYNHLKFYEDSNNMGKKKIESCKNLILLEKRLGRKFIYKKSSERNIDLIL